MPDACRFDADSLIGLNASCPDEDVTITPAHARLVATILQGPDPRPNGSIWWSLPPGAPFSGLANTTAVGDAYFPVSFDGAVGLYKYFALQDPDLDVYDISYDDFHAGWSSFTAKFNQTLGNASPDLTDFRAKGGKILTWHGMADQYIPYQGTLFYRELLKRSMGGINEIDSFHRIFLASGAGHYVKGYGLIPINPLTSLVEWVEEDVVSEVLAASNTNLAEEMITRNLYSWPRMPKYTGGDFRLASSFSYG